MKNTRGLSSLLTAGAATLIGCTPNLTIGVIEPGPKPAETDGQNVRSGDGTPRPAETAGNGGGATASSPTSVASAAPSGQSSSSPTPTAKPTPSPSPTVRPAYATLSDGLTRHLSIARYVAFDKTNIAPAGHVSSIATVGGKLYLDVAPVDWYAYRKSYAAVAPQLFEACEKRATDCGTYTTLNDVGWQTTHYASVYAPFYLKRTAGGNEINFYLETAASGYPYKGVVLQIGKEQYKYRAKGENLGFLVADALGIQRDDGVVERDWATKMLHVLPVGGTATVSVPPGPIDLGFNEQYWASLDIHRSVPARHGLYFVSSTGGNVYYGELKSGRYRKIATLPVAEMMPLIGDPDFTLTVYEAALERRSANPADDVLWLRVGIDHGKHSSGTTYNKYTDGDKAFSFDVGKLGVDIAPE